VVIILSYFRTFKEQKGFKQIFKTGEKTKFTGLAVLTLDAKENYKGESAAEELALVILSGKCQIKVNDVTFENLGSRKDVFSGKATTVYVPIHSQYEVIEVKGGKLEIAIVSVPAEKQYQPFVVNPAEVVLNHRGVLNWQRDVHDIITDNGENRVDRIIVGETFSYSGQWSSYPSHKHDTHNLPFESKFDEIYLFKVDPVEGFGIQVMYTDDFSLREAHIIKDGDAVALPEGYHPVASAPGFRVYYLWVMAGEHGRVLQPNDDPKLKWISNIAPMIKGM
jgi:5-deoxy-glucuronate isomerase